MIYYDPHKWLDHFFDVRGTLVREIGARVGICVAWSVVVVAVHMSGWPLAIPSVLHSLVGVALGLLLVFRTNASYDRYWEGRRLWGGIVNECRNLIRGASVHLREDPELLRQLTGYTAMFPWAAMSVLRGESRLGPAAEQLPPAEAELLRSAQHPAMLIARQMTSCLDRARRNGLISDILHAMLDNNVHLLVGYLGGCERIRKTPLPFAYVVHLRRAMFLYCLTLPFAIVEGFGWAAIAAVLMVTYALFGIEEIGVEIEGPFGDDANDLPMQEICETIHSNVHALAGISHPLRERMPEGL